MSNNEKSEIQQNTKKSKKSKNDDMGWWLFRTKGTVAEPWPTGEELLNDPDVQKEIKRVRDAFNHTNKEQNS